MRIWKTGLAVGVLLAGGVMTAAQEEPTVEKAPFAFKASGETVEDYKIEFVANLKPDHSTPTGIVTSWAAYTDNRESLKGQTDVIDETWGKAVANSLLKHEKQLLTEEAVAALHAEDDSEESSDGDLEKTEEEWSYVRQALEVTGEKDVDGKHWVTATQKTKIRELDYETEEWVDRVDEEKYRFETVKGEDGNWHINSIQAWRQDWENMDEEGNTTFIWDDEMTMLAFVEYSVQQNKEAKAPTPPKQATPKEAANALFESLIPQRDHLQGMIFSKGAQDWTDFLKTMVTKEFVEQQKKLATESYAGFEKEEDTREVESVTEKDGLTIVKYKQADEWMGAVEIHLKKVGEVWKIHKTGYYEAEWDMNGEETWNFVEDPNVYGLAWR